jgi:hypothetical protein
MSATSVNSAQDVPGDIRKVVVNAITFKRVTFSRHLGRESEMISKMSNY